MDKILRDIPVEGKITNIGEDTVQGGSGFAPRLNLRITLYFENEILGVEQAIWFVRPGEPKGILGNLIDDYRADKELRIKGKMSYLLIHPLVNMTGVLFPPWPFIMTRRSRCFPYKAAGMPDAQNYVDKVVHLVGTIDWKLISEVDKKALDGFLNNCPLAFAENNDLDISVDGKNRYVVCTSKNHGAIAAIYFKQVE